jgi:predicted 3-demethylubiquinone-9 3-methyltransferase (glyoxalase superfamily)
MNKRIFPCILMNGRGRAAAEHYITAFGNGQITNDNEMMVKLELSGQPFHFLNVGYTDTPNASISFFAFCKNADVVKHAWSVLTQDGQIMMPLNQYPWNEQYGWVQDKFGVSWQLMVSEPVDEQFFLPAMMFSQTQAGNAEKAMQTYSSIFPNASIHSINCYSPGEQDTTGFIKHGRFVINNYHLVAFDSSMPAMPVFNQGVSLAVLCDTQAEIDYYWEKLLADGGTEGQRGWLKDRFGVSWQIVHAKLAELVSDPVKGSKVVPAFFEMTKLDWEKLQSIE